MIGSDYTNEESVFSTIHFSDEVKKVAGDFRPYDSDIFDSVILGCLKQQSFLFFPFGSLRNKRVWLWAESIRCYVVENDM